MPITLPTFVTLLITTGIGATLEGWKCSTKTLNEEQKADQVDFVPIRVRASLRDKRLVVSLSETDQRNVAENSDRNFS